MKLYDLLFEAKEYTDTDIIDFNEIDIYHEYDKLNKLLFNDELPRVRIILNNAKNTHGSVSATRNRLTNIVTIQSLTMSKFLNVPYKFFKDVLAHEMIHVYWFHKNVNANHDYRFVREMNRINGMGLGFNITIKTDSSMLDDFQVSSRKNVTLIFCIITLNGTDNKILVTKEKIYFEQGRQISKIFDQTVRKGKFKEVSLNFYKSDAPYLQKLIIQRTFMKSLRYENIPDERVDDLIGKSIKISECFISPDRGPQWSGEAPNNIW